MKYLLAYYSETGHTKMVAEEIKKMIDCDVQELTDEQNQKNPADYDVIIIGMPVWALKVPDPVKIYLSDNAQNIKNLAAFCTMDSDTSGNTFHEVENLSKLKLVATLEVSVKEMAPMTYGNKLEMFINKIKSISA